MSMDKFVPFQEFQQQLLTARHQNDRTTGPSPLETARNDHPDVAPENLQKMRDYLAAQHQKMEVVHSFLGDDGQYIDCIKVGTQPGLQPGEQIATPPAYVTDTGSAQTSVPGDNLQNATPKLDRFGNVMQCPAGCIPVRRITLDQIARAGTLENYFKKAPGGGAMPPSAAPV
jgi:hypothetical protein